MWDRPDALNAIASLLYAVAFLLIAYGVLHFVVRLPAFPLREVRLSGVPQHVLPADIEMIVKREVKGNFFTVGLDAARAGFETLPWVRTAGVRRVWPNRLEVTLEEQVPLARWSAEALVNTHGETFNAAYDGKLPVFVGPAGSAKEMAIQYRDLQRSLAAINQVPVQVQLSPRRAWQVKLASGLVIELGREQIEARLDRFISVFERTVGRLQRRLDYVDLRYPNGFAVRVPELKTESRDARPAAGNTKRG